MVNKLDIFRKDRWYVEQEAKNPIKSDIYVKNEPKNVLGIIEECTCFGLDIPLIHNNIFIKQHYSSSIPIRAG